MKIELMKISVRGLELLKVKFETKKNCFDGSNFYNAYMDGISCWNEEKSTESLFQFCPYFMKFGVRVMKHYVTFYVETYIELTKGSFSFGLHFAFDKEDCRKV